MSSEPAKAAAAAASEATPPSIPPATTQEPQAQAQSQANPEVADPTPTAPSAQPAQPAPQSTTATAAIDTNPETAPDPDEDDLSDLDDVLDEFAATNISKGASTTAPSSSGPGRPSTSTDDASIATGTTSTGDGLAFPRLGGAAPAGLGGAAGAGPGGLFASEDEFAKAMQAGMAELLGEFEANPDMAKQFEDLVKELGEGMGSLPQGEAGIAPLAAEGDTSKGVDSATAAAPSSKAAATDSASKTAGAGGGAAAATTSFEDTIRATMERMSASNTAATSATQKSATTSSEEDFLAAMLREMEAGGGPGGAGGMGSDEDFSKMLMGMMEQLTNKEILYEPMKELHDKFPAWMAENEAKTGKEDWARYVEQKRLVAEIVGKFEESGYSDSNTAAREFIVERMQLMQAQGSPPPDLVGDMNAAQEALGDLDAGCPQQ